VNKSLLNVVLHDQPVEQNSISAALLVAPLGPSKSPWRIAEDSKYYKIAAKKPVQIKRILNGAVAWWRSEH